MVARRPNNLSGGESADQLNQAFEALRHPCRRHLLHVLTKKPSGQDVLLVELHDGCTDFESFETELNHVHLPKLTDYGYIDWEKAGDSVRRGPRFDEISPVVELLDNHQGQLPGEWP